MSFFRQDSDPNMGSYILDEIRELRKGQEGNNVEIRGEFAAIRDTITTLSEGVKVTQNDHETMRGDLHEVADRMTQVEKKVKTLADNNKITAVKKESSWDGPKKILTFVAAGGAFFSAVVLTAKGWPLLLAFLNRITGVE